MCRDRTLRLCISNESNLIHLPMIHRHTTLGGIYSRLNRIERTCERMSRELAAIRRVVIQPRKADIDQVVERLRRTAIDMQRQARAERDSLSRNMRTH